MTIRKTSQRFINHRVPYHGRPLVPNGRNKRRHVENYLDTNLLGSQIKMVYPKVTESHWCFTET